MDSFWIHDAIVSQGAVDWVRQARSSIVSRARVQSCPTLCDPRDGPAVPGILQARTLEWVAISSSNA